MTGKKEGAKVTGAAGKGKSFKTATESFLTIPQEESVKEEAVKEDPATSIDDIKVPKGWRLVKESRSARLQLLVTPTISGNLKTAAAVEGISINELCNRIFEEYLNKGGKE